MKKIIALLLICVLFISGCSQEAGNPTTPSDSTHPTPTEPTSPNNGENADEIQIEKYLWEKDFSNFKLSDLTFDNQWEKKITVGDVDINSTTYFDISNLPNYFYEPGQQYVGLETAYHVPHYELMTQAKTMQLSNVANINFFVTCTTKSKNVIVDKIRVAASINQYEGGVDSIVGEAASYTDGKIGIGSKLNVIKSALGEPFDSHHEELGDGTKYYFYIYTTADAELSITAISMDGSEDNAIVTAFEWVPLKLRAKLHTQENIQYFHGYPGGYNP